MRIKVFYHSSLDQLEPEKKSLLMERIVPQAVKYWENIITVRNPVNNIKLNRRCKNNRVFTFPGESIQYCKEECVKTMCGDVQVPESHLTDCHTCNSRGGDCAKQSDGGPGVSGVDFLLYVSSLTTEQCLQAVGGKAETVAYAAHCQQEEALDRPVAGHTNICPSAISDIVGDRLTPSPHCLITGQRHQQSPVDTQARTSTRLSLLLQSLCFLPRLRRSAEDAEAGGREA